MLLISLCMQFWFVSIFHFSKSTVFVEHYLSPSPFQVFILWLFYCFPGIISLHFLHYWNIFCVSSSHEAIQTGNRIFNLQETRKYRQHSTWKCNVTEHAHIAHAQSTRLNGWVTIMQTAYTTIRGFESEIFLMLLFHITLLQNIKIFNNTFFFSFSL